MCVQAAALTHICQRGFICMVLYQQRWPLAQSEHLSTQNCAMAVPLWSHKVSPLPENAQSDYLARWHMPFQPGTRAPGTMWLSSKKCSWIHISNHLLDGRMLTTHLFLCLLTVNVYVLIGIYIVFCWRATLVAKLTLIYCCQQLVKCLQPL